MGRRGRFDMVRCPVSKTDVRVLESFSREEVEGEEVVPNPRSFFFLFFSFSFFYQWYLFKVQNMRGELAMATKTL